MKLNPDIHPLPVALLVLQFALPLAMTYGDIGFDHAGRYGLDIEDGAMLFLAYVACLLWGIVRAALKRQWLLLIAQIVIPIVLLPTLIQIVLLPTLIQIAP